MAGRAPAGQLAPRSSAAAKESGDKDKGSAHQAGSRQSSLRQPKPSAEDAKRAGPGAGKGKPGAAGTAASQAPGGWRVSHAGKPGLPGGRELPAAVHAHMAAKGQFGRAGVDAWTGRGARGRRWGAGPESERPELHRVRAGSRVGVLLREFGGQEDWVSTTLMKHQMATIIQANVRGWLTRTKWNANPDYVVNTLHQQMADAATEAERRAKLRRQLEVRAMTQKQKKVASTVVTRLFGSKTHIPAGAGVNGPEPPRQGSKMRGSAWAKLQKNADIAVQEMTSGARDLDQAVEQGRDPSLSNILGSDADSEFSDLEMEDITAVKLRARTPPWQKQEESQRLGQMHKLHRNPAQSSLEMRWDLDACADRLEACKARRLERHPGDAQKEAEGQAYDPETQPLPPDLIANILYPKYRERMIRLGLAAPEDLPELEISDREAEETQVDPGRPPSQRPGSSSVPSTPSSRPLASAGSPP